MLITTNNVGEMVVDDGYRKYRIINSFSRDGETYFTIEQTVKYKGKSIIYRCDENGNTITFYKGNILKGNKKVRLINANIENWED